MYTQVTVVPQGEQKMVIAPSKKNPAIYNVRVEQEVPEFSGRFLNIKRRVAYINGSLTDLLKMNYQAEQELEGKIVVIESTTPPNSDNLAQHMKIAGETNLPCTIEGQPIYRQSFYTTNIEAQDVFIQHDNGEEIREANRRIREEALNTEPVL